jgi:exosortase/archaeosortase family protein
MFTGLFLLILAVEWHNVDKKRMLAIFLPGLFGMFVVNVIRIFLLMLMGIWISPDFAVGLFHSNAGWLLFVAYFVLFWMLALPSVRKRK